LIDQVVHLSRLQAVVDGQEASPKRSVEKARRPIVPANRLEKAGYASRYQIGEDGDAEEATHSDAVD
jgi:hypothetical protein